MDLKRVYSRMGLQQVVAERCLARRHAQMPSAMLTLLIFAAILLLVEGDRTPSRVYVVKSRSANPPQKKCKVCLSAKVTRPTLYFQVYSHLPLHKVMDTVCLMCHEMFSHERPNMRGNFFAAVTSHCSPLVSADCRSNCFKSEHFRKCLDVFAPTRDASKLLLGLSDD